MLKEYFFGLILVFYANKATKVSKNVKKVALCKKSRKIGKKSFMTVGYLVIKKNRYLPHY